MGYELISMFRRRPKQPAKTPQPEPFTYVHHGTTLSGELKGNGRVRIHGTVRGNIRVDGVLEVAEAGVVEGAWVVADHVKIIGRVEVESLTARGKVEIWRGGELIGDVKAASLDIEEGARFTGRSEMTDAPTPLPDGKVGQDRPLPSEAVATSTPSTSAQRPERAVEKRRLDDSVEQELLGQSDDAAP